MEITGKTVKKKKKINVHLRYYRCSLAVKQKNKKNSLLFTQHSNVGIVATKKEQWENYDKHD